MELGWGSARRFKKKLCVYLTLAMLGLCCYTGFSLAVVSRSYSSLRCEGFSWWLLLLLLEDGLWGTQAPVVAASGLSRGSWALGHRLSTCGTWA